MGKIENVGNIPERSLLKWARAFGSQLANFGAVYAKIAALHFLAVFKAHHRQQDRAIGNGHVTHSYSKQTVHLDAWYRPDGQMGRHGNLAESTKVETKKPLHEWTYDDVQSTQLNTVIYTEPVASSRDPEAGLFAIARCELGLTAYLCVPAGHPLTVVDFDDEGAAHGGINIRWLAWWDPGLWAWGWSYDHLGDEMIHTPEVASELERCKRDREGWATWPPAGLAASSLFRRHAWLPAEVWADSRPAVAAFSRALDRTDRTELPRR